MGKPAIRTALSGHLEGLYRRYNRRARAARDPVQFLYRYKGDEDRETAGLVAALLAYGALGQILDSVSDALGRLGPRPSAFVREGTSARLDRAAAGFRHRFAGEAAFRALLGGMRGVLAGHGTLQRCFLAHDEPGAPTVLPGLTGLAHDISRGRPALKHLVANPALGSACKRWHLYLRWMVRRDRVDVGAWRGVSPARLVVPLDTHTWRLGRQMGFIQRKTCNLKAALEMTEALRRIRPDDPARYDFALMHASVEGEPTLAAIIAAARSA